MFRWSCGAIQGPMFFELLIRWTLRSKTYTWVHYSCVEKYVLMCFHDKFPRNFIENKLSVSCLLLMRGDMWYPIFGQLIRKKLIRNCPRPADCVQRNSWYFDSYLIRTVFRAKYVPIEETTRCEYGYAMGQLIYSFAKYPLIYACAVINRIFVYILYYC